MNSPSPAARTRVALVTGGSRGIGRAIGERLAADGYHTVLTYRADAAGAEAAVAAVREAGGSAEAVKADVTSADEIAALADRLDREREGVDVLVNNAAVLKNGLFALMPDASWNLVIDTALGGTYRVTKAVMRGMLRRLVADRRGVHLELELANDQLLDSFLQVFWQERTLLRSWFEPKSIRAPGPWI